MVKKKNNALVTVIAAVIIITMYTGNIQPFAMIIPGNLCETEACDPGEMSETVCDVWWYDTYCPSCYNDQEPNEAGAESYYCDKSAKGYQCSLYDLYDTQSTQAQRNVYGWLVCCNSENKPPVNGYSVPNEQNFQCQVVCNTDADTNCDGDITYTEINAYVVRWLEEDISWADINTAIRGWLT